jgi:hypothetical protein
MSNFEIHLLEFDRDTDYIPLIQIPLPTPSRLAHNVLYSGI